MSGTSALSIYIDDSNKAELAKIYGGIIENLQKKTLSQTLKSQNYTGDIKAGSVEFKRFTNAVSKEYGTARAAGKGDKLKAPPVTVNVNIHREIVEEAAISDIERLGVASIVERRKVNHQSSMVRELETSFFEIAVDEGNEFSPSSTDAIEILNELIVTIETTKNEYVNGITRDMIVVVCSAGFYERVRTKLDGIPTTKVDVASENFGLYHGVKVFGSIDMPADVEILGMVQECIAQPVIAYPYDAEKIPLSNDVAIELFYDYGLKALMPDLIQYVVKDDATLNELTVTSTASTAGKTEIAVTGETGLDNRKLIFKINASTAPAVAFDQVLKTGWADVPVDGIITATNVQKITVAEITTSDNKAKASGSATIVSGS